MPELRTADDVARWLSANDITAVRVEGTNLDGSFIGKVVSPARFLAALDSGITFSDVAFGLDLGNTPVFGFALPAWRGELGDILLRPDLDTLVRWQPGLAAVIGDFHTSDGEPLPVCPRGAARRQRDRLRAKGFETVVAVEMEATVFSTSIEDARTAGYRGLVPLGGTAGSLFHLAKTPDWYGYLLAVTRRLDELGIAWEAFNDEAAWGQVELNLAPADPVTAGDCWARARQVMREVAFERGHCVTFMAKWSDEYGQGSHINLSLSRGSENAFYAADAAMSEVMTHFLGGVMATIAPAASLMLPFITSFRRLHDLDGPPTSMTWGIDNKTAAVRAIVGHPRQTRLEYRIPGADANIYLALATVMAGGAAGLDQAMMPPPATDVMAWCLPEQDLRIPDTIGKAAAALRADTLLTASLGAELVDYWLGTKQWEWWQFHTTGGEPDVGLTGWELQRYFELA